MLRFYWSIGKDIEERKLENKYGSHFYETLSHDLILALNKKSGFAPTSLRYAKSFYCLYSPLYRNLRQVAENFNVANRLQAVDEMKALATANARLADKIRSHVRELGFMR